MLRHQIFYTYGKANREASFVVYRRYKITVRGAQRIADREILGVRPIVVRVDTMAQK